MSKSLVVLSVAVCCAAGCAAVEKPQQLQGAVTTVEKITPIIDKAEPTYHVQRAERPPVIDGKADEWQGVPAMVLDRKEQSRGWNGPDDLSGSLRLQWDTQALYFCLEVTDNVHNAPNADSGWWENDCCQFALDPYMNGPQGGYDPQEHSYLVGDSPKGPILAAYRTPGTGHEGEKLLPGLSVKMSVDPSGRRAFEWAMPWDQLAPVSPWILGRCGFCFTINDNDGQGFKGALFWTPGVIWGQDASKFGQVIFDGAPGVRAGMLGLPPEGKITGDETSSQWLSLEGSDPFGKARLLAFAPQGGPVEAKVTVCRRGEAVPVAVGKVEADLPAGKTAAFVWDVGGLPDGPYELAYDVPALRSEPLPRMPFFQLNIESLRAASERLRAQFGTDRPWDDMATAPALLRRHRGMVAAALELLQPGKWGKDITNRDVLEEQMKALSNAAAMVADIDAGRDFLARQRGIFWCAYYSPADGSGQNFVVVLPPDFDPRKTYPLIVNLHGAGGVPTPQDTGQRGAMAYIEVMPWGRGVNSYRALGEADVLAVIDYMKQWHRIDPDRVYVMGASMGGYGVWRLASRHPDLFAAAAPICGYSDALPLENLRNVPVFNHHGMQDWTVPLDLSRFGVSLLQKLGYSVLHKEVPEASHSITGMYPVRDWLLTHRRPDRPAAVTCTCETPDEGRAYWLRVCEVADPHLRTQVAASVSGRGPQQMLTLLAPNAAAIELDVAAMPLDRQAALLVQAGETFLEQKAPLPGRLFVVREGDAWRLADRWSPPESGVRPYRAGAAADLYAGEPLLIVYGTQADEKRNDLLKRAAGNTSLSAGSGADMPSGGFPTKADADVTDEDMQRFNLVIIGGPRENKLAARIMEKLPVTINEKNELVAGGRDPVSLEGAGLCLAHCNPLVPKRLIYIVATDAQGEEADRWYMAARRNMAGADGVDRLDQPDLVVQTIGGPVRRRMQFTHGWQWVKPDGSDRHIPEAMASAWQMGLAQLRVMRRAAGTDFALGWGQSRDALEFDPRFFTLADLATARTPGQTLTGRLSGAELIEIHEKWIAKDEIMAAPAFEPKDIAPDRLYSVALPPNLCWRLQGRERNLRDVQAGPEWRAEDLWAELIGQ